MSGINKKRKLQHASGAHRTPAEKRGGASLPTNDPRFQMNSDFSDSDEDEVVDKSPGAIGSTQGDRRQSSSRPSRNGAVPTILPESQRSLRSSVKTLPKHISSDEGDEDGGSDGGGRRCGSSGSDGDVGGSGGGGADGSDEGQPAPKSGHGRDTDGSGGGLTTEDGDDQPVGKNAKQKKVLTKRKLLQVKEASNRRGIVYVSRIPPHMKPHKLRQLLEPFGDIGRVYCAPEDPALRRMRKKKGGNSGKNFTEGWVEFEDKRRAKRAALALNGQPMGGSKRSAYYYDLWNIKYLPRFKWDSLTEEINYQRAVHEQRLVAEISAAKRERDFYLSRVDKAKAIDAIQERRRAKKQQQQEQPGSGGTIGGAGADHPATVGPDSARAAGVAPKGEPHFERHFGQRRVKADPVLDDRAPVLADDVLGLLGRKRKMTS